MIWKLIKAAIHEWQWQVDSVEEPTWQYLSEFQQHILSGAANQDGTTILRDEEAKIREARQLEDMKLVTMRVSFGAYWIQVTPEGRKVLSQRTSIM